VHSCVKSAWLELKHRLIEEEKMMEILFNTITLLLLSDFSGCMIVPSDINTLNRQNNNYVHSYNSPLDSTNVDHNYEESDMIYHNFEKSDMMYHNSEQNDKRYHNYEESDMRNHNSMYSDKKYNNSDESDMVYHNSMTALDTPQQCHLLLVCAILQSRDALLSNSSLVQGLLALAEYQGDHPLAPALAAAVNTGLAGSPCTTIAPDCHHTDIHLLTDLQDLLNKDNTDLQDFMGRDNTDMQDFMGRDNTDLQDVIGRENTDLQDITEEHGSKDQGWGETGSEYNHRVRRQLWRPPPPPPPALGGYSPHRRQGLLSRIPPIFRPDSAGRLAVCQGCDRRGTVCTVYGIGTFIGCNGVALAAGPGGPAACNAATTPGSIGCGLNTLYCYSSGCGFFTLPRLPGR